MSNTVRIEEPVYWLSKVPEGCQLTGEPFDGVMYDAKIKALNGQWGLVCQSTFDLFDCRLGLGYGQKYELQEDGRWLKTAG